MSTTNHPAYILTYTTIDPYMALHPEYRKTPLARNGQWLAHSVEDILTFAQEMVRHSKDIEWTPVVSTNSFIKGEVYEAAEDGERKVFGHFEIFDVLGVI